MENDFIISSNNNQENFYPLIHKKQILLDWINTIDEPHCLILNEIKDLFNGRVLIELLRHLLKLKNAKNLLSELNLRLNLIKNNNPYHILFISIDFFSKTCDNENAFYLSNLKQDINNFFQDESYFIDLISIIKNIYDDYYNTQIQYPEKDINERLNNLNNNNDIQGNYNNQDNLKNNNINNYNKSNKVEVNKSNIPKYNFNKEIINIKNKNNSNNLNNPELQYNNFLDNQNYDKGDFNNKNIEYNNNKLQYETIPNNDFNYEKYLNNNSIDNKKENTFEDNIDNNYRFNSQKKLKISPLLSEEYIPKINENKLRTIPNKNNIIKEKNNKERYKSNKLKNKILNNNIYLSDNIPNYRNENIKEEKEINQIYNINKLNFNKENYINMTRGIEKKNNNYLIDIKNITFNYFKFLKLTEPIVEISYNDIIKYKPFSNENNNLLFNNHQLILDNINFNNNNYIKEKEEKKNIISKSQKYLIKDNNNKILKPLKKKNENGNTENNSKSSNSNLISNNLKKKIYSWLIDLNIIKEKIIKIEDIPNLFSNGILYCDLINRLEGKNETIKGIIRKIKTKSDVQVNINKFLSYLRNIEKFPSRNLWNNKEIFNGNEKVIFELLEDLCNYYSNFLLKKNNYRTKSNNNKINNENNNFYINEEIFNFDNISNITLAKNNKNNKNNIKNNILNISNSVSSNINTNNFNHLNDKDDEMFNLNLNLKKPIYRQKRNKNENQEKKKISNKISSLTILSNIKDMTNSTINNSYLTTSKKYNNNNNSCFILFEKESAKKMRNEIEKINNQYSEFLKNKPRINHENKSNSMLMNLIMS